MDVGGPQVVRPHVERSGVRFVTLVDAENALGNVLGYRAVPNGFLVDEEGVLRYAKVGGFDVSNPGDTGAALAFLAGQALPAGPPAADRAPAQQADSLSLLRSAAAHLAGGRTQAALAELERALAIDPDNFIIRKQIWRIRYPERFDPVIDLEWQQEQLLRERQAEARRKAL